MASCAHGVLTAPGSTGLQTVSGLTFQPDLVWFYASLQTATGWGTTGGYAGQFCGHAVDADAGKADAAAGAVSQDNVVGSNYAGVGSTTQCIRLVSDGAGTVAGSAGISTFNADGFTLDWAVAASSSWKIYWLAFGGSDVTHAYKAILSLSTSGGNQASAAPGFQPDWLCFLYSTFLDGGSIGWAGANPYPQGVANAVERDGRNPSEMANRFSDANIVAGYRIAGVPAAIELDFLASLVSFDATGYTLNKSDPPAANRNMNVLAMQGGGYAVGVETVPTSTGQQTLAGTENARGVLFVTSCRPAGFTDESIRLGMGATDGTSQAAVFYGAEDAASPTVVDQYSSAGLCLVAGADPSTQTLESTAEIASVGTAGVTLNWTAVSGDEEQFLYVAFGTTTRRQHLLQILGAGT